MDAFYGEIRAFPFFYAPAGWMECNGQLLSTGTLLEDVLHPGQSCQHVQRHAAGRLPKCSRDSADGWLSAALQYVAQSGISLLHLC
jgi:hypothetical protein